LFFEGDFEVSQYNPDEGFSLSEVEKLIGHEKEVLQKICSKDNDSVNVAYFREKPLNNAKSATRGGLRGSSQPSRLTGHVVTKTSGKKSPDKVLPKTKGLGGHAQSVVRINYEAFYK